MRDIDSWDQVFERELEGIEARGLMSNALSVLIAENRGNPLLTWEEEVLLFQVLKGEKNLQEVLGGFCSQPNRKDLWGNYLNHRASMPETAQEVIVETNYRLVIWLAFRGFRSRGGRSDLNDLVQAGNLGLLRAIERFDYQLGHKFNTYAFWWIRQGIFREINRARVIPLPINVEEKLAHLRKTMARLTQDWGKEPTADELVRMPGVCEELGLPADLKKAATILNKRLVLSQEPVPLNRPPRLDEDEEGEIIDYVGGSIQMSEKTPPLEEEVLGMIGSQDFSEAFELAMEKAGLKQRERRVLVLHFQEGINLKKISEIIGLTRERVRQIRENALKRMKPYLTELLLKKGLVSSEEIEEREKNKRRREEAFHRFFEGISQGGVEMGTVLKTP